MTKSKRVNKKSVSKEMYLQALDKMTNNLWNFAAELLIFRQLFVHDRIQDTELMNETAGTFFFVVQQSIFQRLTMALARLADPPSDKSGNHNLSLEYLVSNITAACSVDEGAIEDLDQLAASFRGEAKRALGLRHKVFAHSDLKHALGPPSEALAISIKEIDLSYKAATALVKKIYRLVDGRHVVFELTTLEFNGTDGEALLVALRQASEHRSECTKSQAR